MTHHEQREHHRNVARAAGDPRVLLLAATPPDERSEAAARYDHRAEVADLETDRDPTEEEYAMFRLQLWRAQVAVALTERGGYTDIVSRYMGGLRVSASMARAITQIEADTPLPERAEVLTAWAEGRHTRRLYLRARYGI